jgi:hypothetical protein
LGYEWPRETAQKRGVNHQYFLRPISGWSLSIIFRALRQDRLACTYERCYESSAPGMLLAGFSTGWGDTLMSSFWLNWAILPAVWKVKRVTLVTGILRVIVRTEGDATMHLVCSCCEIH